MTKKVIAFDLDDTLAITKSPITDRMGELLARLLEKYEVCVISGGSFEQFNIQIISRLNLPPNLLTKLHLLPTCGTQYYIYNEQSKQWKRQYANFLTEKQKKRIFELLEEGAKKFRLWETNPMGEIIEDRDSQVTYSALGQQATAEMKHGWDSDGQKRQKIIDYIKPKIPELEVRFGGSTSIDITMAGVDKAYGMRKLMEQMNIEKGDILFIGDKIQKDGNDYPVKAMGIDTIAVKNSEETEKVIEEILADNN